VAVVQNIRKCVMVLHVEATYIYEHCNSTYSHMQCII